jgi:hypothetical protein
MPVGASKLTLLPVAAGSVKGQDAQAGRYGAFITNFSEGYTQTEYEMYKWLAYVVVVSEIEELERGLRRSQVSALIKASHPMREKLNEGNITIALQNAASLQVLKSIRPIIFDYDQTTRVLNVVDRSFLIWLAHQERVELLKELGINADGINAARVPPENLLL